MQNPRLRPAGGSKLRTVLLCAGAFSLLGVAGVTLWWTNATRIPVVNIPDPVMPNPNAFDVYVKAGNAIVNYEQIGDAFGVKPKATYSTAQKEALVLANTAALNKMHQGFAFPYHNPPVRSFGSTMPYYARFRGLARLLSLQAQVRAERGDWSGSADSCLEALRMGEDIPYGSAIVGDLVGIACQALGRKPMWHLVEHLNAAQSHAAIARLAGMMDRQHPYADTLQEEKWAMQAALLEVFRNPKKREELADEGEKGTQNSAKANAQSTLFYLAYSKARIMSNYTAYMDQLMAQARRPYGLHLPPPPAPSDPINRMMIPELTQTRLRDIDNETQNGLLLVTLALHAFQIEYGHYPASLVELAPAYLKRLPEDPFAAQGIFKYLVKGKSYVLYSVGPDGKDDGGTPIDDPKHSEDPESTSPNARSFVHQNSIGDIVAGRNQW